MALRTIVQNSGTQFNTSNYPIELTTDLSTTVNWVVSGYGNAIGDATGNYVYDRTLLPVTGTALLEPGAPLVFPFVGNAYPANNLFDAIVVVTINSIRAPAGFSNSVDNASLNGSPIASQLVPATKNVYWTDLYCFFGSLDYGSPFDSNPYMFGGNPNACNNAVPINFYCTEVLQQPLPISWTIESYDIVNGLPILIASTAGSFVVSAGVRDYQGFTLQLTSVDSRSYRSYDGYFRLQITTEDPNFESLLNYYHWGVKASSGNGYGQESN